MRRPAALEGYTVLKIYEKSSSREAMLRELETLLQTEETVRFGPGGSEADVTVTEPERGQLVRELRRRFEPVSLKGWRNIFSV